MQNFVLICPQGHLGEIYAKNFSNTNILFYSTHLQVRPLRGFVRAMAQMTWPQARYKPFKVKKLKSNI